MTRQRVRTRSGTGAVIARILAVLFALLLIYGGVADILLSLKLTGSLRPAEIEKFTDYRTIYHWVAALHVSQFTTAISLIAGFTGLLVFLFFVGLLVSSLPRPYLTRTDVDLPRGEARGETTIRPRALERIAEVSAQGHRHVVGVTGRVGEGVLHVDLGVDDAPDAAQTMRDVRTRVAEGLARHQLPSIPVSVTVTGYEPSTERPTS